MILCLLWFREDFAFELPNEKLHLSKFRVPSKKQHGPVGTLAISTEAVVLLLTQGKGRTHRGQDEIKAACTD